MLPRIADSLRATWTAALVPALATVTILTVAGCQLHRNPHDFQDTPPITRLDTIPRGAAVSIERFNLRLGKRTPVDLPTELRKTDVIAVTLDGYHPWHGAIGEIPQSARGTYELVLQPLAPSE